MLLFVYCFFTFLGALRGNLCNSTDFLLVLVSQLYLVPGQEVDQRKLGKILCKKTVEHMD